MRLYLISAAMLQLNALSFAAPRLQEMQRIGRAVNPGFLFGVAMTSWFCWDYLIFERVHVYTYDIFAERVGF